MKVIFFVMTFLVTVLNNPVLAGGPWRGQVIDIETKEPLEDVVVLAVWERVYRTPAGANPYFYRAKEVLTDKEGRFEIPSYTPINLLPLISYMRGPYFFIFKPEYGYLEMNIGKYLLGEIGVEPYLYKMPGYMIKVFPGIIELPKLKTWEKRRKALWGLPSIPDDEMSKLIELMNKERIDLGLQPVRQFKGDSK